MGHAARFGGFALLRQERDMAASRTRLYFMPATTCCVPETTRTSCSWYRELERALRVTTAHNAALWTAILDTSTVVCPPTLGSTDEDAADVAVGMDVGGSAEAVVGATVVTGGSMVVETESGITAVVAASA